MDNKKSFLPCLLLSFLTVTSSLSSSDYSEEDVMMCNSYLQMMIGSIQMDSMQQQPGQGMFRISKQHFKINKKTPFGTLSGDVETEEGDMMAPPMSHFSQPCNLTRDGENLQVSVRLVGEEVHFHLPSGTITFMDVKSPISTMGILHYLEVGMDFTVEETGTYCQMEHFYSDRSDVQIVHSGPLSPELKWAYKEMIPKWTQLFENKTDDVLQAYRKSIEQKFSSCNFPIKGDFREQDVMMCNGHVGMMMSEITMEAMQQESGPGMFQISKQHFKVNKTVLFDTISGDVTTEEGPIMGLEMFHISESCTIRREGEKLRVNVKLVPEQVHFNVPAVFRFLNTESHFSIAGSIHFLELNASFIVDNKDETNNKCELGELHIDMSEIQITVVGNLRADHKWAAKQIIPKCANIFQVHLEKLLNKIKDSAQKKLPNCNFPRLGKIPGTS